MTKGVRSFSTSLTWGVDLGSSVAAGALMECFVIGLGAPPR